jgi:pimeloyl-ACP methyl ester carboxylesterase
MIAPFAHASGPEPDDASDSSSDHRNGSSVMAFAPPYHNSLSGQSSTQTRLANGIGPPLGVTGVICASHQLPLPHYDSDESTFLHYTVFRPRQLKMDPVLKRPVVPPLVACPGGPLLPSYYLQNLVHTITDRAIVLYDPVGCGRSSSTRNESFDRAGGTTLVHQQAFDLVLLLKALNVERVHLLGHSLGGCVAYECCRLLLSESVPPTLQVISLVLVSAPVSIQQSRQDAHILRQLIATELQQQRRKSTKTDADDESNEEDQPVSIADRANVDRLFWERHECRTVPLPLLLEQSLRHSPSATSRVPPCSTQTGDQLSNRDQTLTGAIAAKNSSIGRWAQEACASYVATPFTVSNNAPSLPTLLVLRGEHDFCSAQTCGPAAWGSLFLDADGSPAARVRSTTLNACAHYSLLENDHLFGNTVGPFLREIDATM